MITRDVLESYLNCRTKGHLKLAGEHGIRSDYEALLLERREEARLAAIDKVVARHPENQVARNVPLTAAALKAGPLFVLDAGLEDDVVSLHFDGLKRVDGPSQLGDFHYVPMLFHDGPKVRKEQRLLLEVYGLLLSRVQGRTPGHALVWHGREGRGTRVRLGTDPRRAERLLRDLEQIRGGDPPRLLLNDHCQVCEFRQRCHEQAVREDCLSLLRGVGEKEVRAYARKGILTLTQLAHTFRPRRKGKRQVRRAHHRYHALQALAVRDKRIYVFGTPELRDSPVRIYLDVEGVPDEGFIYLIGMAVVQSESEERHSFWADDRDQEQSIFEQFLATVNRYDDYVVFCYGNYERAFLKRMRKTAKRKKPVDRVLDRLVNVLSLVYAHVYFPCHSNSLKDVAGCLGCSWTEPDASGLQSLVWRARWEATKDEGWRQKLRAYNLEDCVALRRVAEAAYAACSTTPPASAGTGSPPVARVQDIDRWANNRTWGTVHFVHPDYQFINDRAYFDYQRDRVFVRTSRTLRRSKAREKGSRNRTLRAAQRLTVTATRCPSCGGRDVNAVPKWQAGGTPRPRVKRAFDVAFTAGRIKRRVIECRTSVHRCSSCGRTFVPHQHLRLDKHFHGLKSWAMFLHVAHRLSLATVRSLSEEFFGLRVSGSEVHMFKSLMAGYYRATFRRLLRRILAGNLLHVDETEIKLQTGKGYVWVFTNLEEVVFLYRPTREGDFLRELLKDFRGVLVSDFYAAYDSLGCPQQKCLIHLMRDMNQELLNNPFDEELRSVTGPFGTLLRAVITTVDEHGLRHSHLAKHERDVEVYFQHLAGQAFASEAARGLQERLLRCREKLFTFVKFDGIPWNNNNAENAIKRFAYYREDTTGMMREGGLRDYLLLLSLCQTCRYKRVSFLKFLLSRQRDVDSFCEGRRARRGPVIELYPKGFIPSHFRWRERAKATGGPREGGVTSPGATEGPVAAEDA
jgi:predicted RecB family nuclease